jgi:hypothetical protein
MFTYKDMEKAATDANDKQCGDGNSLAHRKFANDALLVLLNNLSKDLALTVILMLTLTLITG